MQIRQTAIANMVNAHQSADKVLVLDNSVQYCSNDIGVMEMMLRIRYSPWTTRVWTLQEGRLGQGVMFQFLAHAVSSDIFHDTVKMTNNLPSVSKVLAKYEDTQTFSSRPLSFLARALASYSPDPTMLQYADMPIQDNPTMEELRITAKEIMKESREVIILQDTWGSLVSKRSGGSTNEDDEHPRVELRNILICPVTTHSVNIIHRVQDWGRPYVYASGSGASSLLC